MPRHRILSSPCCCMHSGNSSNGKHIFVLILVFCIYCTASTVLWLSCVSMFVAARSSPAVTCFARLDCCRRGKPWPMERFPPKQEDNFMEWIQTSGAFDKVGGRAGRSSAGAQLRGPPSCWRGARPTATTLRLQNPGIISLFSTLLKSCA